MTTSSKLRQNAQKYSIFLILIAMFIICSILSPYFLTSNNLINILRQTCVGLLIAYGEMILIPVSWRLTPTGIHSPWRQPWR